MADAVYPRCDATMAALELWAVAHGVAALLISRPYLPFGDVEEFADRVMGSACCGQVVTGIIGVDRPPQEAVARIKKGLADG
jgi:hypothetical protein